MSILILNQSRVIFVFYANISISLAQALANCVVVIKFRIIKTFENVSAKIIFEKISIGMKIIARLFKS